jgi:uncharacterized membrane protein YsdA (DUF1294 family)
MTEWNPIVLGYGAYLVVINVVTAYLYYRDKRAAQQGKWRVAERTLFLANFLGGVVGAWLVFLGLHHKTRHTSFWVVQIVATVVHGAFGVWALTSL